MDPTEPARVKLALFLPSLVGGGAERVMVNLAHGFAEAGLDVDLLLSRAEGAYLAQIAPSVRIVYLRSSRTMASLPALIRYLKNERPSLLISALNHANIVALWAKRLSGVPTSLMVTVHNQLSQATRRPARRKRVLSFLMRRFFSWADEIVAVSDGVAEDLSQSIGLERALIHTIYNPVVSDDMLVRANLPIDHPWFAEYQPPVILAIGRLTEQKDFGNLIRAFHLLRQERSCRLVILGDGEERPALLSLIEELDLEDSVSLPGFVENPYAYLKRARIFALSSKWEGLPTVLIEALALGTRIVSTDCESGPREILEGGRYGTLVPVGSVERLARALGEALEKGGLEYDPLEASRKFTWISSVRRYLEIAGISSSLPTVSLS